VGDKRFGPNTDQVDAFLERLRRLNPSDWERVIEAAPGVGAIPDLEVSLSPDYFKALQAATRAAKSEVFPGSESAFFDAMRTATIGGRRQRIPAIDASRAGQCRPGGRAAVAG